jgi:hypothetical protein
VALRGRTGLTHMFDRIHFAGVLRLRPGASPGAVCSWEPIAALAPDLQVGARPSLAWSRSASFCSFGRSQRRGRRQSLHCPPPPSPRASDERRAQPPPHHATPILLLCGFFGVQFSWVWHTGPPGGPDRSHVRRGKQFPAAAARWPNQSRGDRQPPRSSASHR